MANNKNNGSFDADAKYVEFLGDKLVDLTNKFEAMSNTLKSTIDLENKNRNIVSNKLAMSSKEIDNAFKMAKGIAEKFGRTTAFNASLEGARASVHKLALSGHNIQEERLLVYLENFLSKHVAESKKAIERGEEPTLKKVDLKSYKPIIEEIEKKLGVKGALTGVQNKLMAFFGDVVKDLDKKRKRMVDDLVEGLASSKFIGGALNDTFKLIGLMGASWLSHFGQLGRILGGAFYVAMTAFGPSITKMLVEGLGKLMWSGLKFLSGTIWKAITSQALRQGAGNLIYSMSKNGVSPALQLMAGTGAEKASAVAKIGGLGLAAGAGFMGAKWAGGEAADSWRQGRKGNAVAMGAGAGLMGAGGLAAIGAIFVPALASAFLPVIAPVLAIGVAIAGIAKLWKMFHKRNQEKDERDKEEKGFWQSFWDWLKNMWPFGKGSNPGGGGPSGSQEKGPLSVVTDNTGVTKIDVPDTKKQLKIAKDGSILNLADFTQKEASAALQAYEKADPIRFNRVYEWAGPKAAHFGSYKTDAVKFDSKGNIVGTLQHKGATSQLEELKSYLIAQGIDPKKVATLGYTSGKMTGSNISHGKGGWKSHNNPYALGFDIGGGKTLSDADYNQMLGHMKAFYKSRGFNVDYEREGQGKSTGRHIDVKPLSNWRPEGAVQNLKEYEEEKKKKQQVEATKHSVEVEAALKKANEAAKTVDTYGDKDKKMSTQERENLIESVMKKQGFKYDNKQNTWTKASADDINKVAIIPPTGNDDFLSVQQNLSTVVMYGGNQERIS